MSIEADWSRYARFYDSMAQHNPAYQQLVELYTQEIRGWSIPDGALLAEVGAGTGNFSIPLAEVFPGSSVLHIDINPGMNATAWAKAQQRGVKNLKIEQTSAKELHLEPGTLHGLVAVHALYTFPKPQAFIEQAYQWLQPGGIFFACDPCKALDVREWSAYIFQSTLKRRGLVYTLGLFARSWEAIRQNRRIASGLQSGSYWNHTRDEFTRTFVEAGYQILQSYPVYREYSLVVIAQKGLAQFPGRPGNPGPGRSGAVLKGDRYPGLVLPAGHAGYPPGPANAV